MSEPADSLQLDLLSAHMNFERAVDLLNSRKASPKEKLDDMRGSDDMDKWSLITLSIFWQSNQPTANLKSRHNM